MTPRAHEISEKLADRIDFLCRTLLPAGRRLSGSWRVGSLAGEQGGSLAIELKRRRGLWIDHATGDKGDALDLVKGVLGYDTREALRWSRQWLGIDQDTPESREQYEAAQRKRRAARAAREAAEREIDAKRLKFALALFEQADNAHGTATEAYLGARKLELPDGDDVIRHHPRCVFGDERAACMVALFRHNLTNEPVGIQRTRLPPDGWARGMRMQRLNLGPTGAGSIKIDPVGDELAIGEGTESVLALRKLGYRPCWATGGKGTIRCFPVLPKVRSLFVHWEPDAADDVRECLDRRAPQGARRSSSNHALAKMRTTPYCCGMRHENPSAFRASDFGRASRDA